MLSPQKKASCGNINGEIAEEKKQLPLGIELAISIFTITPPAISMRQALYMTKSPSNVYTLKGLFYLESNQYVK